MGEILDRYRALLDRIDGWFSACAAANPAQIVCGAGCNGCCFALTQHDAWQYGRYRRTIGGKTPLAWMGLPVSRHLNGCGW